MTRSAPLLGRARLLVALACFVLLGLDTVLVAARTSWVVDPDATVSRAAARAVHARDWLVITARVATQLGNPLGVDVAMAVLAVALLIGRRWWPALAVVLARLVGLGVQQVVKDVVDRPRPKTEPAVAVAGGTSFPSGHAAGAATIAVSLVLVLVVLGVRRRVVAAAATLLAVLTGAVAVSRVLLVVHYPSDVLGGLLLGVAAATVSFAFVPMRRRDAGAG